jgi:hypothetical protein
MGATDSEPGRGFKSLDIEDKHLSNPIPRCMKPTDTQQAIQTEYQIKHLQKISQVCATGVEG